MAVPAPIGTLGVAVDDAGVCAVNFAGPPGRDRVDGSGHSVLDRAAEQVAAYFDGELTEFDLPLSTRDGSEFERAVWAAIAAVPYGEMITYGAIATSLGDPGAARAVGAACHHNPHPILVPCHRVVGAGGKLVGFGGGLPRKRFLLELEARVRVERAFG